MKESILIVEDQFIEANDLRSVLENAGYRVCGIARSVPQAYEFIEADRPDMLLVDIFLKGKLTGIDLAKTLGKQNIPFIYLSANSNQSTLEEAKATQPYGFLVKPFRERDIIIALEIAFYRFHHGEKISARQEQWLTGLLSNIITKETDAATKLLLLAKAFQPFTHFDCVYFDTNLNSSGHSSVIGFHRISYDEYQTVNIRDARQLTPLAGRIHEWKQLHNRHGDIIYSGGADPKSSGDDAVADLVDSGFRFKSEMIVPVRGEKELTRAIFFYSLQNNCFNDDQVTLLKSLLPLVTSIFNNVEQLILRSGKSLNLQETIPADMVRSPLFSGIIGSSPRLLSVLDQLTQVAPYDTSVLIQGETGSGKEGLVNVIHLSSPRRHQPLIKINCAAIPEELVESELFGHERGAFTGATERRIGKFELAQGGTIFLDEIGEIPLDVQSKLLRVIQEKEIERVGGRITIKTDVRIIAATNKNLHHEVAKGNFRMDLYYRIHVFPINLPPLRERREDIPLLVAHFLSEQAALTGERAKSVSNAVLEQLLNYSWPGNIRQLQHLIERSVITHAGSMITSVDLPKEHTIILPQQQGKAKVQSIEELEKTHILRVIKECNGKVGGKGGAAEVLGISVSTLMLRIKKLGIRVEPL